MAVTVLMHMNPGKKCAHEHLQNAIHYILKPEKTEGGALVGGNSGISSKEILFNFLETKRNYEKLEGRQGYHFVISFSPGETNKEEAYAVVEEFCRQYLGENYDYVFALHTDKEHMHGHIIFNSVSRTTGYKYHYKNGDWKKYIQPVTDKICKKYGLKELVIKEERVGVSYASWHAKKENGFNQRDIYRADIDYAIRRAGSYEEFLSVLANMGYEFNRSGKLAGNEAYISLRIKGMKNFRRSSKLGPGYSLREIKERIQKNDGGENIEDITKKMKARAGDILKPGAVNRSSRTFRRLYQAVNYYQLPNPYAVPAYRVRKDMLNIRRLSEECQYLKKNNIQSVGALRTRYEQLEKEIALLYIERKTLYLLRDKMSREQMNISKQYCQLKHELNQLYERRDDRFEELEDQIKELESSYPKGFLEVSEKITGYNEKLARRRSEKRMVERLMKGERIQTVSPEQEKAL